MPRGHGSGKPDVLRPSTRASVPPADDLASRVRAQGPMSDPPRAGRPTRLFVVHDHVLAADGLRWALSSMTDLVVCGTAAPGPELVRQVREQPHDVVVVDIALSGWDGVRTIADLRAAGLAQPILALSSSPDERLAIRALEAGATGYLTGKLERDELVTALRTVAGGRRYVARSLRELIERRLAGPVEPHPHEALTARELDVLRLIVQGTRLKEIAAKLDVSEKTITTHRRNILDKMGLENNAELVLYAIRHGLTR